jgi:hypothetical protein
MPPQDAAARLVGAFAILFWMLIFAMLREFHHAAFAGRTLLRLWSSRADEIFPRIRGRLVTLLLSGTRSRV